ncbi:MAG: twin-arginine translocation pathway signal [Planctomycetaceae bacterium]|nr:twin-arginine translocation pathway signal [Planctomycetaceae bacterium]
MSSLSRRIVLKSMAAGTATIGLGSTADSQAAEDDAASLVGDWSQVHDRVWLGEDFWANPMENWRVIDGAAECLSFAGNRSIHLITHQLTDNKSGFETSVRISKVQQQKRDGGAGFRIGVRSDINEFRSNCFARSGINAGVVANQLQLGSKTKPLSKNFDEKGFTLSLTGKPSGGKYLLQLALIDGDETLDAITLNVAAGNVLGNIALVNNFADKKPKGMGSRYRFRDWHVAGDAFTVSPDRKFGPILWSMYTLSDSRGDEGFVLKLSALTGPLGKDDNKTVELHVPKDGDTVRIAEAELNMDAWTATFRIPNWDATKATPYTLVYRMKSKDGKETTAEWSGTIKASPSGRPLRLGALTCQNDYAFPYEPVANNLVKLDPDMLYFSGDQLYESHGGFGIIRDPAGPAILNYLRKFYQFGWAFREALKDRPTVCIPDDHDVFQGNIWGEAGAKMTSGSTSSKGGYREPARMVNVVHRTCAGHHPDYFDPTPVQQNISVYYGDMVYGGVSFAILGDRQFKSGPERVETGSGRADHVTDRNFDTAALDKPGLVLLGERQEKFLEHWVNDWRGHNLKVLLSQTVFAGVATHHGGYNGFLKADLDCGGWPQTARDRAIKIISKGMPLHINGDQHLTTLAQYGVDQQRDGCWSFCTPAIAAGYPRWWRPDDEGMTHENRPKHGLANTGEFIDGFGNKVYVYAVGNPVVPKPSNRYQRAHQKGSGFGLVTIDTRAKTYHIESFRFLIDPTDGKASNQFPGWPVTLQQKENAGDNVLS